MSNDGGDAPSDETTERLFDQYVARVEVGDNVPIDEFCAAHPRHSKELHELLAIWRRAQEGVATEVLAARHDAVDSAAGLLDRFLDRRPFFASRYRVSRSIKTGGMGAIFVANDLDVGRDVAIKIIRDQRAVLAGNRAAHVGADVTERFLEEARITGQLEHPAIVPVHEIGVDDVGRPFFTMKLVHGRELGDVFEQTRDTVSGWTQARAVDVLLRVCDALAYAHDKGVIHRDLKPSNVMVGDFGEVYVMDWGIAQRIASQPVTDASEVGTPGTPDGGLVAGATIGTPSYMAPEQARGDHARIGPQSDVYAVGAMLYQLLAGRPPFQADGQLCTPSVVRERLIKGELEPLPNKGVSVELQAICAKAMAREPVDRYAGMRALATDLRAYIEGRVVGAHQTGSWAEFRKWAARNKGTCAFAATTIGAVLLGMGALAWTQAQARTEIELESDVYRVPHLLAEDQDKLWPSSPRVVPEMRRWITDVDDVLSRAPQHAEIALAGRGGGQGPTLPNDLSAELASLAAARKRVVDRVAFSEHVAERLATTDAPAWSAAIADIACSPVYRGLKIGAQEGLVPIGQDPDSGLWEFADLRTGIPATRDSHARIRIDGETSVTLVLVPGGTFLMGAQNDDPAGPNYDVDAKAIEGPVHAVVVLPFFVSKYEMTQGQYIYLMDRNPSVYPAGTRIGEREVLLTNPVEGVSWPEAGAALRRADMRLPSEEEWEYTARAGTSTPWWCGSTREGLDSCSNVADRSARRLQVSDSVDLDLEDGFGYHAPVGSFVANGFGLHDTIGNVTEWVSDHYRNSYSVPRASTVAGELECQMHVNRSGSHFFTSKQGRSAWRDDYLTNGRNGTLGFRPARDIQ